MDEDSEILTVSDFFSLLGFYLTRWNAAEQAMRKLLASLAINDMRPELDIRSIILTTELGNRGISIALESFANEVLPGPEGAFLLKLLKHYKAETTYRNYYVHGISIVFGKDPNDPNTDPIGVIDYSTSKGKITYYNDAISPSDIRLAIDNANMIYTWATQLTFNLFFPDGEPTPLPDIPPPRRDVCKRRRPGMHQRQHLSSEA
ncbi:MAG: hypothetical protein H6882_05130 [Rhodobiaceae bacterium]|nr:hypothetical protein [Rhodobiaceae bacterium]